MIKTRRSPSLDHLVLASRFFVVSSPESIVLLFDFVPLRSGLRFFMPMSCFLFNGFEFGSSSVCWIIGRCFECCFLCHDALLDSMKNESFCFCLIVQRL